MRKLLLILIFSLWQPTENNKPILVPGTDMFWETYEYKFGCSPCPTEEVAIEKMKSIGFEIGE